MKYKIFDTHCHLNCEPLFSEQKLVLEEATKLKLLMNVVGTEKEDIIKALKLTKNENVYCSVGFHPCNIYDLNDEDLIWLEKQVQYNPKIIAIGEIGLDYHYPETNKEEQKIFFIKQIELAIKFNKPIVCHIRDAHFDALEILKQYHFQNSVIIHCFDGLMQDALNYQRLGFYISISGMATFKNKIKNGFDNIIEILDKNLTLTETDSPWLAPVPFRGKTNYPSYVQEVNKHLAKVWKIDLEIVIFKLTTNGLKAFNII